MFSMTKAAAVNKSKEEHELFMKGWFAVWDSRWITVTPTTYASSFMSLK
jgi:hypothetical protein